jgi:hypothetical protein
MLFFSYALVTPTPATARMIGTQPRIALPMKCATTPMVVFFVRETT